MGSCKPLNQKSFELFVVGKTPAEDPPQREEIALPNKT